MHLTDDNTAPSLPQDQAGHLFPLIHALSGDTVAVSVGGHCRWNAGPDQWNSRGTSGGSTGGSRIPQHEWSARAGNLAEAEPEPLWKSELER